MCLTLAKARASDKNFRFVAIPDIARSGYEAHRSRLTRNGLPAHCPDPPPACPAVPKAQATRITVDKPPSGLGWSARLTRLRASDLAQ
jgi:hypothetical protein